ncbi:hypothetical protein PJL18_03721 [Paenarthrobacter nicotinovorans]|nr:hypothetical protein [Paenarthrobacter nicotinovorans]
MSTELLDGSGRTRSSLRTNVTARSEIRLAVPRFSAVPTSVSTAPGSVMGWSKTPRLTFHSRIRRTDSSRRASLISPDPTAARTPANDASTSGELRRMSDPAWMALTAISSWGHSAAIAAMSKASVVTSPLKPSSSRSRPVSTLWDRVPGMSGSMASTMMCAVMTMSTPASIAALNGWRCLFRVARS